jgi:hypothetical protein
MCGEVKRGLGIALHPDFRKDLGVYPYWTSSDHAPVLAMKNLGALDVSPGLGLSQANSSRALLPTLETIGCDYAVDAWNVDAALAEGRRLNRGLALSASQVRWLRSWAAIHPPGSHRRR